ncbi:hypothetical protein LCGC14_2927390 [marine sediment metagenome]|uniref:Uncharacterized protein n=1 Tax=marine sediment metagenome TaxID=412755 RepID=A0A0F8ZUN0_9ZZZZ
MVSSDSARSRSYHKTSGSSHHRGGCNYYRLGLHGPTRVVRRVILCWRLVLGLVGVGVVGPVFLLGIAGALLLVMLPMATIAFLKLRKRDLSVMLEGSGWGINAPMRLTHHQAQFFTQRPKYPKGSKGILRLSWRALTIILILLIAFATAAYLILHVKSDSPSQKPVPQVQNLPAPTTQN